MRKYIQINKEDKCPVCKTYSLVPDPNSIVFPRIEKRDRNDKTTMKQIEESTLNAIRYNCNNCKAMFKLR